MGIPTGNSNEFTHVAAPVQVAATGTGGTDPQTAAASLNVVLEEASAMTEEISAHSHNASEASKEAQAEAETAALADPLGPIDTDGNRGDGGSDGHHSKGDQFESTSNEKPLSLHQDTSLDLSKGNNIRAEAEAQMAENQSIYSLGTPEEIAGEINSLMTDLQSDSKGLSSATLKTANSHFGIAAQLAQQLSNPTQTGNLGTTRQDIQAHVTSAYTAIFTELLDNPEQLTAVLSSSHSKEAAEMALSTLKDAQSGKIIIPGGNFTEVMKAAMKPQDSSTSEAPPPTMQVVSSQKLCDLLGAFAAATQNNQVEAAKYSSSGSQNSADIASTTVISSRGQLNYVQNEVHEAEKKQARAEKKQKEAGIWQKIGVALMCVAIVITVAVMYVACAAATAVSGGLASPAFIAAMVISAALIAVMTTSIAAAYSDDCPDLMGEAIAELATGLAKSGMMSKEDAAIAAAVIVIVLMMVVSCGVSFALAPAAAGTQGAAAATSEATATTASTISARVVELASTIGKSVANAAKAAVASVDDAITAASKLTATEAAIAAGNATSTAAKTASAAVYTAVKDLVLLIPRAIASTPELLTSISQAADTAAKLSLILGPVSKAAAIAGLITSVNEGATQIELGLIMISLSKNIANIGVAQANMELLNYVTTMQTQQSGVTMESYKGITTQLSNTGIQEAAGAGKTLADQLSM